MADKELDELFRRFVREHDVRAVGELFDAAAPQLARIAWHLTHDASGMEDLVQATFLTALGTAREFAAERRVMPWLLRILLNHARNARRASERKPESLAVDIVDPRTPESDLERRELREVVEHAVSDLPDTYREVVSTWLIEGATPTEIAHRTGKPAATVRVQLRRGLELLRSGLPAGVAGLLSTNGWSASSFASTREVVLTQAARIARTLAPTSAVVAGGLLLTTKWLLIGAAAVVTAAGVGWFVQREGAQSAIVATAPVVNANEPRPPLEIARAATEERSEVIAAPPLDARQAVATPLPGWWLIGDVDGASATDRAHLTSLTGDNWSADVTGSHFEVEVPAIFQAFRAGARGANSFTARYDSPRFMPTHVQVMLPESVDLDADYTTERVELHMQIAPQLARLVVTGRVVAPSTFDVSRAVVALCALDAAGRLVSLPTEAVRCSTDDSFRVRSLMHGAHALAVALAGLRPATRSIAADSNGVIDLGEIVLELGEHLAGSTAVPTRESVLIASMAEHYPSLSLEVLARPSRGVIDHTKVVWANARFEWDKLSLAVDACGAFRFAGLAPVAYRIGEGLGGALGSATDVAQLTYMNDESGPTFVASLDSIVLAESRRTIRIDVRADGAPVDGAAVVLNFGSDGGMQSVIRGHLADLVWNGERSATVRVVKDGWASNEVVISAAEARAGAVRVIELARQSGLTSVTLRPRIACSNDAGSYSVQLVPLDKEPSAPVDSFPNKTFSLSDSEWRFDNVAPGRYRIEMHATGSTPDRSWCVAPMSQVECASGESVVRELTFVSGGRLALTVFGEHATGAAIKLSGQETQLSFTYFDAQKGERPYVTSSGGRFRVPIGTRVEFMTVFEPGVRTLTITLTGSEASKRRRMFEIVPGQTAELVVDFSKPDER